MSLFIMLAISLGICLVPVCLVSRAKTASARDYFVASQPTPADAMRNCSVVYFLRIATLAPFFAWGASGDFWTAVLIAACLGLGVYLVSMRRHPILEFLDSASSTDASGTVHAFVAQRCGNDARVRLLAASLTVAALTGLITLEAFATAVLAQPVLIGNTNSVYLLVSGMLLLAVLYTILSGNSGVMHSVQLQLGIVYFGLFGSIALLLYFIVSDASPTPPQAKAAIMFVAAAGALIMFYRRSKYVETARIETAGELNEPPRSSWGSRLLSRLEKVLNPFISAIVVFVVVVTAMEIFSVGLSAMARDSFTALRMNTHTSAVALGSLALLAFLYPIVDARTWQTLAAAAMDTQADSSRRSATLQRIFHSVAIEVPLVWLLMCMFGTVAVVITETSGDGDAFSTFISWLAAEQGGPADFVLSFLLVGMFAMVLAAMSSMLSAMLWVVRYDVVPAVWPDLACQGRDARDESTARRRTLLIGIGLCVLTILLACIANAFLGIGFTSSNFLIVLIACCCAQLSFAPLLLPAIFGAPAAEGTQRGALSDPWALIILGVGAAIGIAMLAAYGATKAEPWLWAAIPACLASGTVLLLLARLSRGSRR